MKPVKVAIHLHTHYSYDSNLAPAALVDAARRMGLDWIAVTDHDEIDGALEARSLGGVNVIVGEEISTTHGHLIGLFLNRRIPPGMSASETIDDIRSQGGLALAPHPFCTLCDNSLQDSIEGLADRLDAVEVYNAQNPLPWQDRRAAAFAERSGLTGYVGMDAHLRWLPATYQEMREFHGAQDFLNSLAHAELHAARVGFRYYALMGARHFWGKLFTRRLSGFGVRVRRGRSNEIAGDPQPEAVVQPTRVS